MNVMSFLMYVMSPTPCLCVLSVLTAVYCVIFRVLEDLVSFVSDIVIMSACVS